MPDVSAPAVAAPPLTHGIATRQIGIGGMFVLGALSSLSIGMAVMGAPLAVIGVVFLYTGVRLRLAGDALPALQAAHAAAQEGHAADAERILDELEGRFQVRVVRQNIDLQRALLALARGDLDGALARADAVIACGAGFLGGNDVCAQVAEAQGVRALILASRGEGDGARAAVAVLRGMPATAPDALARAAVAEAVLLERAGERDALAAHLTNERRLLLDHTDPRERAIVRAFRRMLKAPRTSAYRTAAPREREPAPVSEDSIAYWVAQIAPAAASFTRSRAAPSAAEASPARSPEVAPDLLRAAKERLQGKGAKRPSVALGLLVWGVLIMMSLAIWQFLSPPRVQHARVIAPEPPVAVEGALPLLAFAGVLTALPFLLLAWVILHSRRRQRDLAAAVGALARGDAGAEARLESFTHGPRSLLTGHAHLHLARLEEQRAALTAALAHCDKGIASVTGMDAPRAIASVFLLPALLTQRAVVLAATGRDHEASAEMAAALRAFPAYPLRAAHAFVVELVQRVRRGDLEGAAQLAGTRSEDLSLSLRHETLADLARAVAHPEGAEGGETERLKEDLLRDAELRRWLEVVAPAVLAAFSLARDASDETEGKRDAEAEREAAAEQEEAVLTAVRPPR